MYPYTYVQLLTSIRAKQGFTWCDMTLTTRGGLLTVVEREVFCFFVIFFVELKGPTETIFYIIMLRFHLHDCRNILGGYTGKYR